MHQSVRVCYSNPPIHHPQPTTASSHSSLLLGGGLCAASPATPRVERRVTRTKERRARTTPPTCNGRPHLSTRKSRRILQCMDPGCTARASALLWLSPAQLRERMPSSASQKLHQLRRSVSSLCSPSLCLYGRSLSYPPSSLSPPLSPSNTHPLLLPSTPCGHLTHPPSRAPPCFPSSGETERPMVECISPSLAR
ncbi:hypothetical protein BC835DRAFT_263486 [Cytidiella melzeri]|nr:hypothetical protein BC835DRAFT_263486 [Cytidiella melzeri]